MIRCTRSLLVACALHVRLYAKKTARQTNPDIEFITDENYTPN